MLVVDRRTVSLPRGVADHYISRCWLQEAHDVWSLGVMAFELLTGSTAVIMLQGKEKVCATAIMQQFTELGEPGRDVHRYCSMTGTVTSVACGRTPSSFLFKCCRSRSPFSFPKNLS